jgi:hypothetical protein
LHIIKDGSVREWMLASEMTMSSYSSTVVEAAAAGRPVCLAAPLPFPPSVLADWNHVAPLVRSQTEFEEFLESGGASVDCAPLVRWANENLFPNADPIGAVVDLLHAIRSKKRPMPAPLPNASDTHKSRWRSFRRGWSEMRKKLLPSRRAAGSKGHELDRFSAALVAERTSRWDTIFALQGVDHSRSKAAA